MARPIQPPPNIRASPETLGPDDILTLRGARSRSDFAEMVGVSPLTVYRWELPSSAKEARRPRGRVLERLRRIATEQVRAPPFQGEALDPDARDLVHPVLQRMFAGDVRGAEIELVSLFAGGRLRATAARTLVSAHLALAQVLGRNDARSAFVTLTPALAELPSGALPAEVEIAVHLAAAWVFGAPIGELYDPMRAEAHAAALEALDPSADVRLLAWAATISALLPTNDILRLGRLFARAEELVSRATTSLARHHAELPLAIAGLASGAPGAAVQRLEAFILRADAPPTLRASALALLALQALDSLGDPRRVIALAQQARADYISSHVMPDLALLNAVRAEAEALARLGRFADAEATYAIGERAASELRFPALMLWSSRARLSLFSGDADGLARAARRLREVEQPHLKAQAIVHALHEEARAALLAGDGTRALDLLARTLEGGQRGVCLHVTREVLVAKVAARLLAGTPEEVLVDVLQAEQALERFPSPMLSALLRLYEAFALALQGRMAEALPLVEAVQATAALAENRPVGLMAAWCHARLSGADVADVEAQTAQIGLVVPPALQRARVQATPLTARDIAPLLVPVKRLSVRGIGPALICKELAAITANLLPQRRIRLEVVDPTGQSTLLHGEPSASSEGRRELVEFSDGCGRHYRLVIDGALEAEPRAWLSALASIAGLSLEVASLRGLTQGPAAEPVPVVRTPELPGFIAASPEMRRILAEIAGIACSDALVLITGESGTGKEVVARAVHDLSSRAGMPYVAFNCAAIPNELFEGHLFGYRKGAFTGAATDHEGVIRGAQGGTLLFDEIAELSLESQAKLLRFLENREILPLGELRPLRVDVRVLASTNQNLAALVRERRFREDLYYRLDVVPLHVPPLRERPEDVLALARHFIHNAVLQGQEDVVLAPDAMAALLAHPWPGNARELRNIIRRTLAYAPHLRSVTAQHLRLN